MTVEALSLLYMKRLLILTARFIHEKGQRTGRDSFISIPSGSV